MKRRPWKPSRKVLADEARRKQRRTGRSAAERDAQARTAPVFRALALVGPFVVLAIPLVVLAVVMPSLPPVVRLTSVGRRSVDELVVAREDLWLLGLVPFGALLVLGLVLAVVLWRSLPEMLRSEDGASWATAASLSVGFPAMTSLALVCELLSQAGRSTARDAGPWVWLGLVGGLLVALGIDLWQKRWVRRLVADDPRTGV